MISVRELERIYLFVSLLFSVELCLAFLVFLFLFFFVFVILLTVFMNWSGYRMSTKSLITIIPFATFQSHAIVRLAKLNS